MTSPDTGQLTESVAKSPMELAKGWYWVTKQLKLYVGLVAEMVPAVGLIVTVAWVPSSGNRVASTEADAKSWWKSKLRLASFSPPIRLRNELPNAVTSCSSEVMSRVAAAKLVLKDVPLIVML